MKFVLKYCLVWLSIVTCLFSFAQDVKDLEKKKNKLADEINFANEKIREFRKLQSNSSGELKTLSRQIQARAEMIQIYSKQREVFEAQIQKNQQTIEKLRNELDALKQDYANQITFTYKNYKDYDVLLYIFSAPTLVDMYRRSQYLKETNKYRRKQLSIIQETEDIIQKQIQNLGTQRDELTLIIEGERRQKDLLDVSKTQINKQIQDFRKQERSYEKQVKQKEADLKRINKDIQRMITKAREQAERKAKLAREKAKKENKPEPPALATNTKLDASFKSNMGKLPWPVSRGSIVKNFGKNLHPILRNPPVYTENNGIDISTTSNAKATAIFEGEVMYTFYNPTTQNGIIVMHGDYFTVYTGLNDLVVTQGQKVNIGTVLGTVYTDPDEKTTEVHLEIWDGKTVQNPNLWLTKSR